MGDNANHDAARRRILIRRRDLVRRNRFRQIWRAGALRLVPSAVCGAILMDYGVFWARSLVLQLVGSIPAPWLTPIAAAGCVAVGTGAGVLALARDRAALDAAFLTVQPWSEQEQRAALRFSLLSRLIAGSLIVWMGLMLASAAAALSHPVFRAIVGTILYGLGFVVGSGAVAITRSRGTGARGTSVRAQRWGDPRWLARLDRLAPRWAGMWALVPRWRLVVLLSVGSLAGNLSIAYAAANSVPPASIAPALAVIGSLIVLVGAVRCAPLVSPVLRATPISYHRAALAMFRLPASLACGWLAVFAMAATGLGLASSDAMAAAAGASLLLSVGYALAALTVPRSSRLALVFYLVALAFAADQYAGMQNLAFVVLFGVLGILVLVARGRFRGGR